MLHNIQIRFLQKVLAIDMPELLAAIFSVLLFLT